ncbi:mannonate dehydratase [Elioraea sp.]|uniref:mannonate dehydratase n=1 Tax=Elioraea sp. TaxID=2185103 RepID=UPI0021DEC8B1|nr:mannonate dehydratase [Elioraea sp.]GIX10230.1 MAG: mannonate dehydratase [Elioraea sp.]
MEETWRWFGPADDISLEEIRQTGATGIVTALHEIPYGEVWPEEAIRERQAAIARAGLTWSVVESLPVHENVKRGAGDLDRIFGNYRTSLRNLARCGIRTVCYNFMPVLDWTRTALAHPLPTGATALRFDAVLHAAFDVLMLERPGAEAEHDPGVLERARRWFAGATQADRDALLATIMAGLPGAYDRYDIPGLKAVLASYAGIDAATLKAHLARFLREVVPTAEEVGVRLCIHPDDPPRPLLGLPRIVSTHADLADIVGAVPSRANGITFCTGSLGAGALNDVPAMARALAPHVAFAHLRNVRKEPDGSFYEADHLDGDVDMPAVVAALLAEEARRKAAGEPDWRIPFRPDHGHQMLSDFGRRTHPGYTLIGRLRGLAELRGVIAGLSHRPA